MPTVMPPDAQKYADEFEALVKEVYSKPDQVFAKALFGGVMVWVGGKPKEGKMIGGVTNKSRVGLKPSKELRAKIIKAGGSRSIKKQPYYGLKAPAFFAKKDQAKAWIKEAIETAESSTGKKRKAEPKANGDAKKAKADEGEKKD